MALHSQYASMDYEKKAKTIPAISTSKQSQNN
jgi:hypothetical protein